ncbi:MAG: N-formylglutamate amidohydrolase [Woeseiaceae bacterium]
MTAAISTTTCRQTGADPTADPLFNRAWSFEVGDGPVVAAAIHSGHDVRSDVREWLAVPEDDRFREEDPLTALLATVGDSAIRVFRSRFEVDLNRSREEAVPLDPTASWGLEIWRAPPPARVIERSLAEYDRFYHDLKQFVDGLVVNWHSVLILDIHSYNHRRGGPESPAASAIRNPEINVGTGTMERDRWASLVDRFIDTLRLQDFRKQPLDVRENVKFKGRQFPQWLHTNYPTNVCVLSLELKKIFMDEWRGTASIPALEELRVALQNAVNATRQELARIR